MKQMRDLCGSMHKMWVNVQKCLYCLLASSMNTDCHSVFSVY